MAIRLPDFSQVAGVPTGMENVPPGDIRPSYPGSDPEAEALARSGAALGAFGTGLEKFGTAAASAAGAERYHANLVNTSLAQADLHTRLARTEAAIKAESDPEKINQLYSEAQDHLVSSSQLISDPNSRAAWVSKHSIDVVKTQLGAEAQQRKVYDDNFMAGVDQKGRELQQISAQSPDPAAREQAKNDLGILYQSLAEAGVIPRHKAIEEGIKANQQIALGRVQYLDEQNQPQAALAELKTGIDSGAITPAAGHGLAIHLQSRADRSNRIAIGNQLWGGADKGYGGNLDSASSVKGDLPAPSTDILSGTGLSAEQFDTFRRYMAKRESGGNYGTAPNQEGYMGRYQMGQAEINESAARLGITPPTQQEFLSNPQLQERLFENYTLAHHNELMTNPKYANASPAEKAGILAGAHLGGVGGVNRYLATGRDPADRLGTHVSDYVKSTQSIIEGTPAQPAPAPVAGTGGGDTVNLGTVDVTAPVIPAGTVPGAGVQRSSEMLPLPDIGAKQQQAQDMADRGQITQEDANAIQADLQSRFNHLQGSQAAAKARVSDYLKNTGAALADGHDVTYDPAVIRHFFPAEQANGIIEGLNDAKEAGQAVTGMRTAEPDQVAKQRAKIAAGLAEPGAPDYAKRKALLAHFDAAWKARENQLYLSKDADPISYLNQYDSVVQQAKSSLDENNPQSVNNYLTVLRSEQTRLGVPQEKQSVMSNSRAAEIASQFLNGDPGRVDLSKEMQNLEKYYGDHFPAAMKDLVAAGLPGSAQILGAMTEPGQIVPAQDFQQMLRVLSEQNGHEMLRKAADTDNKLKDLESELRTNDTLKSFNTTTPSEKLYNTVKTGVENLALYYAFRGKDGTTAVRDAANNILGLKYDFEGPLRVPKGQLGVIERAGEVVKREVTPEQLRENMPGALGLPADYNRQLMLDAIQRGYWVTNEADNAAVLYLKGRDGRDIPARRGDGSRIELPFDQAPVLAEYAEPRLPATFQVSE